MQVVQKIQARRKISTVFADVAAFLLKDALKVCQSRKDERQVKLPNDISVVFAVVFDEKGANGGQDAKV